MAIEVTGLAKRYRDKVAVDDISFSVADGGVFAFVGTNGAGKSTTIGCLTTVLPFDAGEVRVRGYDVRRDGDHVREAIGVVFQESLLDPLLTVRENLRLRGHLSRVAHGTLATKITEVSGLIGLDEFLDRRYGKLSGGQRRRVDIARALLHEPAVLFLDEPTAGLDPASRALVWRTLHDLSGLAVLVDDDQSGRFRDFLVAPLRRGQLVLGYLLSAATVAILLSVVVLVLSILYLGLVRGAWLTAPAIGRSLLIVVLSCVAFTSLSALIVSFVRTNGAFSGLATIVGTVLGFIAAAYIPVGAFPDTVASVVATLPFAQAGMLLRREFSEETLAVITSGAPGAEEPLRAFYGLDLSIGDWAVPAWFVVVVLVVISLVCTVLSAVRIRGRIK